MPPIQHNFKNLDEYNSYAKSRGMEELKPTETKDEKGNVVKKEPDFPKSVWEVYASKDGNRNDKVGFSETGKDVKSVTKENAETLTSSLAKEDFFKRRSGAVAGYATAAWNRVSQNIDKLFASFKDVTATSKHDIEDEASAKSAQEDLDEQVDADINNQTSSWTQTVSDDIKTQLAKALEIAKRELGENGDKDLYATKDEDHSKQIDLKESGIEASAITRDVDIKEKVTEALQSEEVIKNSGLDFSKIEDSAGSNLKAEAEKIIKAKYTNIEAAPVKSEADLKGLNESIEKNITGQVAGMKSEMSIENILEQAKMDAMNQIRDEVDKDRKEGQVKAKYDELIKDINKPTSEETKKLEAARQKDIDETTKTGKVTTTNMEEAAKAIKSDREKEKNSPTDPFSTMLANSAAKMMGGASLPRGSSVNSSNVTVSAGSLKYADLSKNEKLDRQDIKEIVRGDWNYGTLTGGFILNAKQKSMNTVEDVIREILTKMYKKSPEMVERFAKDATIQQSVIKGNPEVFADDGKIYKDANWNKLAIPNKASIENILKKQKKEDID